MNLCRRLKPTSLSANFSTGGLKTLIALIFLTIIFAPVHAIAQSNNQEPINIQANQLDTYDQLGESHYVGDVIARQGHMTLSGDTLVVFHPARLIDRIVTEGKPAHFEINDPEQGIVKGHADQIIYYVNQEIAHLIGNAFVDRGRIQSIQAGLIIVDLTTMTMQATGGSDADPAKPEQEKGRVEMIFIPGQQE
jgi:lipopolysaccharide export system protein LptA